jgi:hypothetical protein
MKKIFCFSLFLALFAACKPISYDEHELPAYDGSLIWDRVTKSADWPKRYDHKAVVFQDELWVLGGYTPGNVKGDSYFEDVWRSGDGVAWKQTIERAPWHGRRGHEVVVFDDGSGEAMYLIGGFTVNEEEGTRHYSNDVWRSRDGATWTEIKPLSNLDSSDSTTWAPRANHRVISITQGGVSYLLLTGGQTLWGEKKPVNAADYFNDAWRSTDGITWEALPNNDYGIRAEHAMATSPTGTIYLQGGMHGDHFVTDDNAAMPLPEWDQLWTSIDGVTWTPNANFDVVEEGFLQRSDHELIYYRGRVWCLPGKTISTTHYHFTERNHYPIWTFNDFGDWVLDSEGVAIDARHGYSALVFQDKIWVFGGFTNRNGQANDVWTATL